MDPGPGGGLNGLVDSKVNSTSEQPGSTPATIAQTVKIQVPPSQGYVYPQPLVQVYTPQTSSGYVISAMDGAPKYVETKEENKAVRNLVGTAHIKSKDQAIEQIVTPTPVQTQAEVRQIAESPEVTAQAINSSGPAFQAGHIPVSVQSLTEQTIQVVQAREIPTQKQMISNPDILLQAENQGMSSNQTSSLPIQLVPQAAPILHSSATNASTQSIARHVITSTHNSSPVVLLPNANTRPVATHLNTRNLISSVIDSTRLAMPASLSNANTSLKQNISTKNSDTKQQSVAVGSFSNVLSDIVLNQHPTVVISSANVPSMNTAVRPVQADSITLDNQKDINSAVDNQQYVLRPDGTVGVLEIPINATINAYSGKSDIGAQYVQTNQPTEVAVPKLNTDQSAHILVPKSVESAMYDSAKLAQFATYCEKPLNSSESEEMHISHSVETKTKKMPLAQYSQPTSSNETKDTCEGFGAGDVVGDALKAAVESSGIVPPPLAVIESESLTQLKPSPNTNQHNIALQLPSKSGVTAAQERNAIKTVEPVVDNKQPMLPVGDGESEKNNSLIHFKKCFQFLIEDNCEVPSDSVQPVLNILKNTVKYLTVHLHKCALSEQGGFTWDPVRKDATHYLVPSCPCGYKTDSQITTEGRNGDVGAEDDLVVGATKLRGRKRSVRIKQEEDANKKSSKRKAAKTLDDDFSPAEEIEMDNYDNDDDWSSLPKRKRGRGSPKKTTAKPSTQKGRKTTAKQTKTKGKSEPKTVPNDSAIGDQDDEKKIDGENNVEGESIKQEEVPAGDEPKRRGRPKKPPMPPGEKKEVVKKHVCDTCGSRFKAKAELRRHSTVHTGERPFSCEICGRTFKRHGHLYEHKLVHTGKNIVYCPHCNKKLKSKVALRNHIKTQHEKNLQHMCQICGRAWLTPSMLRYHIHNQHNTERVQCPKCPAAFAKALEMREHLRTHTNLPHICFICGDGFLSGKDALEHRDIQHADRLRNRCHQCGRGFQYATELRKHEATVHAKGALPFKCDWEGCTKTFAKEYMMKYHMKMWHECETKECEVCYKQIKVRVYKRHMLTHTGVKDFRCQYCSAAFSQVGNLKRHMRIHTGEKPYKCNYCEKAFNQSNALKQHLQMHIGSNRDHGNAHVTQNNQTVVPSNQIVNNQIVTNQMASTQFTEISTANQLLTQLTSGQLVSSQLATPLSTTQLTASQLANQLPRFSQQTQHYGFPSN